MKKYILLSLVLLLGNVVFAQKIKVENLQRFDTRRIHFGFSLGINSGSFALQRKPYNHFTDSLASIDVKSQSGFSLGIVSDLHIHKHFNLRFVPTLVFGQRNLSYLFIPRNGLPKLVETTVESTYLDFPLLFKYRSARLNNFAAYVIAGAKYSVDLASNQDVNNDEIPVTIVKLKQNTMAAEVGVGTDFFLPYFKFGIELKMSYTLDDALIHDNTELSAPIERIAPKMFMLTFLFEG
ncbi:MAG: PorT family protein [Bacteroidetes bacterium]|nr:PorT family protein [Flavobacteriales bacterium]NOG57449.1 PorT family protein [Bacteroidota bacterium]